MTLLDAGLLPVQFEIVACDLSQRSLEFARRGRYRAIAFRETDIVSQRLVRQHFEAQRDEWEWKPKFAKRVKFQQANLAVTDSLARLGKFDCIFCRNVLIYLTEEVRQKTLASFKRMLNPGGLLYLGHSECRLGPQSGASAWNERFPAAFTWPSSNSSVQVGPTVEVAADAASRRSTASVVATGARDSDKRSNATVNAPVPALQQTSVRSASHSAVSSPNNYLRRAKELADGGKLVEAESLCRAMLQDQPASADAYCLLGVVLQARGEMAQAETHYQKALFLEPDHLESLTHVLLLAKLRGDTKQVANYQRRLERLRPQGN